MEERSSLRTSNLAAGFCSSNCCLALFAASKFLAPMITCTFLIAKTLTVSSPIPLAPPVTMAVRFAASIPSLTSSAVEADPNPLGPGHPVTREMIDICQRRWQRRRWRRRRWRRWEEDKRGKEIYRGFRSGGGRE